MLDVPLLAIHDLPKFDIFMRGLGYLPQPVSKKLVIRKYRNENLRRVVTILTRRDIVCATTHHADVKSKDYKIVKHFNDVKRDIKQEVQDADR